MDFLASFFGRNGFLPHGYCFTWTPGLLWSMVGADLVIAASYLSIPLAIVSFVRRRGEPGSNGVAWLFSAFILACSTTHMMDVWTIWRPDYGLQALTKSLTAVVSLATAIALWPLIPKALKVPSVARLQAVIATLEVEVRRRREAEDNLDEIQQNLAATLASIGAGFITTDREGRVTRMNGVAEGLTGWEQAAARGSSLWDVLQRDDRPDGLAPRNPVDVVIEQGLKVDTVLQTTVIARDGRRTMAEIQAAVTRQEDGTARGLAIVVRDRTQALRAEADSARLAAIVESSSDAIISTTLAGRITSWNSAAESMFGYRAEEAVGEPVQKIVPEERQAEEARILAELNHGGRLPHFDTERLTRDGRRIDVSVSISPIRDSQGRLIGASKIARDVTRERQGAAALERLLKERSDMLDVMAHEVRQPLNNASAALQSAAAALRDVGESSASQRVTRAQSVMAQVLASIDNTLAVASLLARPDPIDPTDTDIDTLVHVAIGDLPAAERSRVRIERLTPTRTAAMDASLVRLALRNLLSNALKYSPPGSEVFVRISDSDEPLALVIDVADGGGAIPEDVMPRLFARGARGRHPGVPSGHGLGLYIVHRIVELHDGRIEVIRNRQDGVTFRLWLGQSHG